MVRIASCKIFSVEITCCVISAIKSDIAQHRVEKKTLWSNILKVKTAVVSAIKFRKAENIYMSKKIENLRNDILNLPCIPRYLYLEPILIVLLIRNV
jgi:hypothetical protein